MSKESPIKFKGTTLKIIQTQLTTANPEQLLAALSELTGNSPDFFENELAVLDFELGDQVPATVDWKKVIKLLRQSGLQAIATRGLPAHLAAEATACGLAEVPADALGRSGKARAPATVAAPPVAQAEPPAPAVAAPPPAAAPAPAPTSAPPAALRTLTLDKPLRSGQRYYAKGCDLVVTAMVSAGAEVIADGNIHVYAPLRGRALAGASGDRHARIFTTSLEAELVSVAGIYRTFEAGVPADLARQPATVRLSNPEGADEPRLTVEALALR